MYLSIPIVCKQILGIISSIIFESVALKDKDSLQI